MRRLDGLALSPSDCERFAPLVRDAARANAALWPLAAALAAVAVTVADAGDDAEEYETIDQWSRRQGISERTARHRAAAGKIPGARKVGNRWVIPSSHATPTTSPG